MRRLLVWASLAMARAGSSLDSRPADAMTLPGAAALLAVVDQVGSIEKAYWYRPYRRHYRPFGFYRPYAVPYAYRPFYYRPAYSYYQPYPPAYAPTAYYAYRPYAYAPAYGGYRPYAFYRPYWGGW
jgi:hypothetical protein